VPLWYALRYGDRHSIETLIKDKRTKVNAKCNLGRVPLGNAIYLEDNDSINLLLEREDIDINVKDKFGASILGIAIGLKNDYSVEALLKKEDLKIYVSDISSIIKYIDRIDPIVEEETSIKIIEKTVDDNIEEVKSFNAEQYKEVTNKIFYLTSKRDCLELDNIFKKYLILTSDTELNEQILKVLEKK